MKTMTMKTLIVYCTHHGCTEKTAIELQEYLGFGTRSCNLGKEKCPDPDKFDRIIIGGSIHAGSIQKKVKKFCSENLEVLKNKEIGLFICCMEQGEVARTQFENAFPEELRSVAKATACLGGEFNFEKMNFFEKMVVRKIAGVEQSVSRINHAELVAFSENMDRQFNPFLYIS